MYQYEGASEDFISTKLDRELYEDLFNPCYNLSCILADIDGRLSTGTLTQLLTGLEIVFPGVLVLGEQITDVPDSIMSDIAYDPEVSQVAYQLYSNLRKSDPQYVVYVEDSALIGADSAYLKLAENQSPTLRNAIGAIFVETYSLYLQMLNLTSGGFLSTSQEEVLRITNNIRWLSYRLEILNPVPYDLIEILRDLQVSMFYIYSLHHLYSNKSTTLMQNINDLSEDYNYTSYYTKPYTVQDGDTLYSIAAKQLGSAARAEELIVINDLEYPFIGRLADEPQTGVKQPGDTMMIPSFTETTVSDYTYLGCDLKLVERESNGGDLTEDIYGDLQVVEGLECLYQDLKTRLTTELGGLVYHPNYGSNLPNLIGRRKDTNWVQKVQIEASRIFNSETRITRVVSLTVRQITTGVQIDASLYVAEQSDVVPFSAQI